MESLSTPSETFPIEVLTHIIFLGSRERGDIPFIIAASHVSRYWTDAVLSSPTLFWDVSLVIVHPLSLTWSRIERCEAWLKRARNAPVCIFVHVPKSSHKPVDSLVCHRVTNVISVHLNHCCSIIIDCLPCAVISKVIASSGYTTAPMLAEFSAEGTNSGHTPPSWSIDTPILHQFRLRCLAFHGPLPLKNLTSFHYVPNYLDRGPTFGLRCLFQLFSSSPNLTDLDVNLDESFISRDEYEGIPVHTMQCLVRVTIWTENDEIMGTILGSLSFPAIEQLSLQSDGSGWSDFLLPYLCLPSLRVLQMSFLPTRAISSLLAISPFVRNITVADSRAKTSSLIATIISSLALANLPIAFNFRRCYPLTQEDLLSLADVYRVAPIDGSSNEPVALASVTTRGCSEDLWPAELLATVALKFVHLDISNDSAIMQDAPIPFDFVARPYWVI